MSREVRIAGLEALVAQQQEQIVQQREQIAQLLAHTRDLEAQLAQALAV